LRIGKSSVKFRFSPLNYIDCGNLNDHAGLPFNLSFATRQNIDWSMSTDFCPERSRHRQVSYNQYGYKRNREGKTTVRAARVIAVVLLLMVATVWAPSSSIAATRHHSYVGTIVAISSNALTIHSKTHATNYHFNIDGQTKFLQHGQAIARSRFKVGSYVTVSYSQGPRNSMVAWHISLRK
jgi:hypothetical protein